MDRVYEVKINLADPDGTTGVNPFYSSFRTKKEYALPAPKRTITVATQAQLDTAVNMSKPGHWSF